MAAWGGPQGTDQVIIIMVFLVLAALVLSLRLITRFQRKIFGFEDVTITTAFGFSAACAALIVVEVTHGQGLSDSQISTDDRTRILRTLWRSMPCYIASMTLTKLSILLQYRRLFQGKAVQRIVLALMVFVSLYGTWSLLGSLFFCTPVQYFWDPTIPNGRCIPRAGKWFSDASINIITDLVILILPMPYLKNLKLPKRQKVELIAVFALGGFVCVISAVRLKFLYILTQNADVAKYNGPAAYLSSTEVSVGIVCASLPTLRSTFVRFIDRIWPRREPGPPPEPYLAIDDPQLRDVAVHRRQECVELEGGGSSSGAAVGVSTFDSEDGLKDAFRHFSLLLPPEKVWDGDERQT